MEAAPRQRAALRLALVGGAALVTMAMLVATVVVLSRRGEAAEEVAEARPEWDVIEPSDQSYPLPVTPIAAAPAPIDAYQLPTPTPKYVEPPAKPVITDEPKTASTADSGWSGPQTIHNPAAFGPPEDGSLPPIPTMGTPAPQRVAARPISQPTEPRLIAATPPSHWEPSPTTPLAIDEEPSEAEPAEPVITQPAREKTPTRPLRNITPVNQQALLSYTASTNDLSRRLAPEVQAGFQLGKSGAVFAARAKFVSVLRRIAQAKDAEARSTRNAEALAEGLRTLDEADDFVPRGDALEAELEVAAIARSHGVQLLDGADSVSPHDAIARYSQHAAARLAEAAGNEPAGSMALYGLGKSYARLAAQGGDPTAGRKSAVLYRAAVDTHSENYLAANELGVSLARAGRYDQASAVLRQAASQPTAIATVHANLAAIENRRGEIQMAAAARQHSQMLAARERAAGEVSRRHGIEWVSPQAFQRAGGQTVAAAPPTAPVQQPVTSATPRAYTTAAPAPQQHQGGWSGFVRSAKRITGWSKPEPAPGVGYKGPTAPQQRVLR
ncbi:MAG: hypothetical protein AAF266_08965 [Planctomycetota bacterium]